MDKKFSFGLGKGLDSLIPQSTSSEKTIEGNEVDINLVKVNPHQPRSHFDKEAMQELAESIKEHGVLQPLVVTQKDGYYELVAGERRLRAAKMAGLGKVPVIFKNSQGYQKIELALVENLQRVDLRALEEAQAFKKLKDEFGLTQEGIAKKIKKSRSYVANSLRLLELPPEIQKGLWEGKISAGHAKALLSLRTPEEQLKMYNLILDQGLSVRDTEKRGNNKAKSISKGIYPEVAEKLKELLETKIEIQKAKKGGKVIVYFWSEEELNRILDLILKNKDL